MVEFTIASIYIILAVVAFQNLKVSIFMFVLLLPIRSLIDGKLFGLINMNTLFLFILFFHITKRGYFDKVFSFKIKKIKPLTSFIIIFLLVVFLNYIRENILFEDERLISNLYKGILNRAVTSIITIISCVAIVKLFFFDKKIRNTVTNAMVLSATIIVFSLFLSPYLNSIGINLIDSVDQNINNFNEMDRVAGLFNGGDVNSLSTLLNIVVCIILIKVTILNRKINLLEFTTIGILSLGILITGSRMGLMTLVFVIIYYSLFLGSKSKRLTNKSISYFFLLSVFFVAIIYLVQTTERFQLVFERMANKGAFSEVSSEGQRFIRWVGFINFSLSNIIRTMMGSDEIYYVYGNNVYRDPHNFLIKTFYLNGIIFPILIIINFLKLFTHMKKLKLTKFFIPLTIITFISMTIISQTTFIYYYMFIIGILLQTDDFNIKKQQLLV